MQELDEGGGGAVRRRIAWEYPSDARPNDGERGCLRALRGAAAGSLVMVELLVARLGQEIRKTYPLVCKWNARSGLVHASPGPQDSWGLCLIFFIFAAFSSQKAAHRLLLRPTGCRLAAGSSPSRYAIMPPT